MRRASSGCRRTSHLFVRPSERAPDIPAVAIFLVSWVDVCEAMIRPVTARLAIGAPVDCLVSRRRSNSFGETTLEEIWRGRAGGLASRRLIWTSGSPECLRRLPRLGSRSRGSRSTMRAREGARYVLTRRLGEEYDLSDVARQLGRRSLREPGLAGRLAASGDVVASVVGGRGVLAPTSRRPGQTRFDAVDDRRYGRGIAMSYAPSSRLATLRSASRIRSADLSSRSPQGGMRLAGMSAAILPLRRRRCPCSTTLLAGDGSRGVSGSARFSILSILGQRLLVVDQQRYSNR